MALFDFGTVALGYQPAAPCQLKAMRIVLRVGDAAAYWLMRAGLCIGSAVRGPEPETAADQQRGRGELI